MSLSDEKRKEILARIKSQCRAHKLDDDSVPQTWKDRSRVQVPVIPTPSARLNACLGIGGIPLGRIVEIYGNESAGKTTLMLEIIAKAQKMNLPCGFVDMEHALDAAYAEAIGVDMDEIFVSQPTDGNTAMQLIKIMVESGVKLIVLDSIPALVAKDEYNKDIADPHVGLQARMLSQGLRQLAPLLGRAGASAVFINQLREKVGVMYGNPETTPGGRAMKYYASVRIDMRALSKKDEDGRISKITVVKNKLAPPFKYCEVGIKYGEGFDRVRDAVEYAKDLEIITGRSWMTLPQLDCDGLKDHDSEEVIKYQGTDQVIEFINSTEGYYDALMVECQRVTKEGIANERREEDPGE